MNPWQALDVWLFTHLSSGLTDTGFWLEVAKLISPSSGLAVVVLLILTSKYEGRLGELLQVLLIALVAQAVSRELAGWVNSPRPFMVELSINHLEHGARGGFPSTHATVMAAISTAVIRLGWNVHVCRAVVALTLMTMWARVYAGAHFPTDVFAGVVLGSLIAMLWVVSATKLTELLNAGILSKRA
jgi:membrane-associated phospholipid phosphatase